MQDSDRKNACKNRTGQFHVVFYELINFVKCVVSGSSMTALHLTYLAQVSGCSGSGSYRSGKMADTKIRPDDFIVTERGRDTRKVNEYSSKRRN